MRRAVTDIRRGEDGQQVLKRALLEEPVDGEVLAQAPELFGFNAGFSCKSFSRLHNDWASFQTAMKDENKDCVVASLFQSLGP